MKINLDIVKLLIIPFIISVIQEPIAVPMLKRFEIGQSVRKEGPKSHYKKSGTPTMGGIIFFLSLLIGLILFTKFNKKIWIMFLGTFLFGLVGFIDDFLIVVKKDNTGLRPKEKLAGQILIAIGLSTYYYLTSDTSLVVPFTTKLISLGIVYIPFMVFVLVGTVNSVNLTDGLDGLATGVTILVLVFFYFISKRLGVVETEKFSLILIGALGGFLVINFHPAKAFMGDTGSMALGGAVGTIAMVLNMPLLIPIVGGIYFAEALSVIIQVLSFKYRKKRVFLMSPLHHHYEQKGWHETKVVFVFWTITFILCIIGFISIK